MDGAYRGKLVDWVAEQYQFISQPVLRSDDKKGFVVLRMSGIVMRKLLDSVARLVTAS